MRHTKDTVLDKSVARSQRAEEVVSERSYGFWEDKTPCWQMCHCPQMVRVECPAFRYTSVPCWVIEGTYCKLDDHVATGRDTSICELCRVYKKWGGGKPIKITLFGKGIDTTLTSHRLKKLVGKREKVTV